MPSFLSSLLGEWHSYSYRQIALGSIALLGSLALYMVLAYPLPRSEFSWLWTLYTLLFGAMILFYDQLGKNLSLRGILLSALLLRLPFLISEPALSNDFYRFLWDGWLVWHGYNPYLVVPEELSQGLIPGQAQLLQGMGAINARHFSVYPPLNQAIFALSGPFLSEGAGAIWPLRLVILLSEGLLIILGWRLLDFLGGKPQRILFFAINPFIIMEFTANLHFETVMLLPLLAALWLLRNKEHTHWGALLWSIAVGIKLIPLLFLPLLLPYLGRRKALTFYLVLGISQLFWWWPFFDEDMWQHLRSSLALYFEKFEFNASLYYLLRELGYQWVGYNLIAILGKVLPVFTFAYVWYLALRQKTMGLPKLIHSMLWAALSYLVLATTVHPWYLATALVLSIFTAFRSVLVWSWLIFLSYSAYRNAHYEENLSLVALEYGLFFGLLVWETWRRPLGSSASAI